MWLLNTATLHLRFFVADKPEYAILSHRWEEEEVSFRQFNEAGMVQWNNEKETEYDRDRKARDFEEFPLVAQLLQYHRKQLFSMKGMKKIQRFCEKANGRGFEWVWADTCCIDKSSSAELQEAINSMFNWYSGSASCIVFLRDVSMGEEEKKRLKQFRESEWFRRGWTLQELLAPNYHEFVDCDWRTFGTTKSLLKDISAASGIPTKAFRQERISHRDVRDGLAQYSIAEQMSWAALRRTTRAEDMAYCLLGLFRVNMPLLYGEGLQNAFERLQLEILKSSTDETIFASQEPNLTKQTMNKCGLLAPNPRYFSNGFVRVHKAGSAYFLSRTSFECTSHGLRIGTVLLNEIVGSKQQAYVEELSEAYSKQRLYFMPLRCFCRNTGNVIFVPLLRLSGTGGNRFARVGSWVDAACDVRSLFDRNVQQNIHIALTDDQVNNITW